MYICQWTTVAPLALSYSVSLFPFETYIQSPSKAIKYDQETSLTLLSSSSWIGSRGTSCDYKVVFIAATPIEPLSREVDYVYEIMSP